MFHSIYIVTNHITGKQYVGYTSRTVDYRWTAHVSAARTDADDFWLHQSIR